MSGRRNELARARRRARMKEALSLTSAPKSEEDSAGAMTAPTLNIDNHFGWQVLQKSQIGDGTFPHLFQYYEKPDIHGRDFDKVTYVLYMDKGTIVDKNTPLKGVQNAVSGILVTPKPSTPGEYYVKTHVERASFDREIHHERPKVAVVPEENIINIPDRRKKKKLISEFYYVRKDRSRSRSPGDRNKGGHSDADGEWQILTPDVSKSHLSPLDRHVSELENNVEQNKDRAARILNEIQKEKEEAIKSAKKDWNANIHQLRAGAENIEREYKEPKETYERVPPAVKKKNSKLEEYAKNFKSDKHEVSEELLKTSSGTNQYLFVSGKKRLR